MNATTSCAVQISRIWGVLSFRQKVKLCWTLIQDCLTLKADDEMLEALLQVGPGDTLIRYDDNILTTCDKTITQVYMLSLMGLLATRLCSCCVSFNRMRYDMMHRIDPDVLGLGLLQEDVFQLMQRELGEQFPEAMGPLLHERNWQLSYTVQQVGSAGCGVLKKATGAL